MCVVDRLSGHFTARLNAEIGQVSRFLAMIAKHTGSSLSLSSKGSGGLWLLICMEADEAILLKKAMDYFFRGEIWVVGRRD
jgi:hypothetical protein